jgi:NAD dependent epimerase/dehydratase family enzyme
LPINFTPNVPAFVLKTVLGERSILTLTNQNIYPTKLLKESFTFEFPKIEMAIENLIHGA